MDPDPLQHAGMDKVMSTAVDDGCFQQTADSADVYTPDREAISTELDRIADKINRE